MNLRPPEQDPEGPRDRAAPPRVPVALAALALALGAATGCGDDPERFPSRAADPPSPTVVTQRPANRTVQAPRRLERPLAEGEVRIEPGAFTDRVSVSGLRFSSGERPRVSGAVRSRTDVSDLLALELRADFYDADGKLVASGTKNYTGEREPIAARALRFTIPAARPARTAVAAVFSIPQLVNE